MFKDFNAGRLVVHSFKVPTRIELKQTIFGEHYIALPGKRKIFGVFNRTHYENSFGDQGASGIHYDDKLIPGIQ